jgi:hypothetical protein
MMAPFFTKNVSLAVNELLKIEDSSAAMRKGIERNQNSVESNLFKYLVSKEKENTCWQLKKNHEKSLSKISAHSTSEQKYKAVVETLTRKKTKSLCGNKNTEDMRFNVLEYELRTTRKR